MRLVVTAHARADLVERYAWIAADDRRAAARYLAKVRRILRFIAGAPEMGRARDELATGLRSFPVERHVVFYKIDGEALIVVRVLHGSRDIEALFCSNASRPDVDEAGTVGQRWEAGSRSAARASTGPRPNGPAVPPDGR